MRGLGRTGHVRGLRRKWFGIMEGTVNLSRGSAVKNRCSRPYCSALALL